MKLTPVVSISFLLYAGVSACLSPVEGDNCLLPKQKEWQIIIILMIVRKLIFKFFFLAMKEHVNSIYSTPCQKMSCYSGFSLLPVTAVSNVPGAAAQGSVLPPATAAHTQSDVCVLGHDLMKPNTSPAQSPSPSCSWGYLWEQKI